MLRIKEVLKEKKISQIELGDQLGISTVGVNKIINGNPTAETLQKIADVLNVDIRDLFQSSTEGSQEAIYVKRDGEFVEIGKIDLTR